MPGLINRLVGRIGGLIYRGEEPELLLKLIRKEGNFNESLRKSLSHTDAFASGALLDQEQIVDLFRNNLEFNVNMQLQLLRSDYHLVRLMETYLSHARKEADGRDYGFKEKIEGFKYEIGAIEETFIDSFLGRPSRRKQQGP